MLFSRNFLFQFLNFLFRLIFFLTVVGVNIFVTGFNETHKRKFSVKRENYFPLENQNKLAYYVTMKSLEPNISAPDIFIELPASAGRVL